MEIAPFGDEKSSYLLQRAPWKLKYHFPRKGPLLKEFKMRKMVTVGALKHWHFNRYERVETKLKGDVLTILHCHEGGCPADK